ncbi:MAG: SPOR domain-containing protein [Sulfurimonas sp.]|nr:SPOR domain-containing protein [Sulfurimonas sp.]
MEEKNELNNIILNKGGSSASSKKIILAVATLGVTLIVVIMLMNTLTSKGTDNLPQAMLPPEPQTKQINSIEDEPLFEEVEVIQDTNIEDDSLDKIAQKLKKESIKEKLEPVVKTVKKEVIKPIVKKEVTKKAVSTTTKKSSAGNFYIQVGSFARYEPNKKFLNSITKLGYKYKFHKVTQKDKVLNKVLVGPFYSESEARKALKTVRSSIEAGAFLTKI